MSNPLLPDQSSINSVQRPANSSPIPLINRYLESIVGGPIWQGIVSRENQLWAQLSDKNRQFHSVSDDEAVEGLIDITDHCDDLFNWVNMNKFSNGYHIKGILIHIQSRHRNKRSIQEFVKELGNNPNLTIAGGAAVSLVAGLPYDDIDLFLITLGDDLDDKEILEKWSSEINRYIEGLNVTGLFDLSLVALSTIDKNDTKVQLILRSYRSLTQVLMTFDIGACQIGVYRGRVYATERALYELVNRTVMISMDRASAAYVRRLIKYAKKGFNLFVEGVSTFTEPSSRYLSSRISSISRMEYIAARIQNDNYWVESPFTGMSSGRRAAVIERLPTIHKFTETSDRQGSTTYYPMEIELKEWTGTEHVVFGNPVERGHINSDCQVNDMKDHAAKILNMIDAHQSGDSINYEQLVGSLRSEVSDLLGRNYLADSE